MSPPVARRRSAWPIWPQFIATTSVGILLMAAAFATFFPARGEKGEALSVEQRASQLASLIAVSAGIELIESGRAQAVVDWALANRSIEYLRIVDAAGVTLADVDPTRNAVDRSNARVAEGVASIVHRGTSLGTVRVGLSREPASADFPGFQLAAIAITLIALATTLALQWHLARRIADPIRRLREAADRVARGDYAVEIEVGGSQEIAGLSDAFGTMIGQIKDRHAAFESNAAMLAEARDAALAAARAKADFLASMSHEIRTPMNGILGMLDLLAESKLSTKQTEFVRTASSSGNALLTIIDDILDSSKIEAGKLSLERTDFDFRQLVEDVGQLLAQRAHAKGLELVISMPETVPAALVGDPVRLRQVLLNLGGNAVKFTEQGQVEVRIVPETGTSDTVSVLVEILDTGIGIPIEVRDKLFLPFTQADSSTTRRFGGTGLGLSISRRVVELMGGTIGVRSNEPQGTVFWIRLTLGRGQKPPVARDASALRGRRVLVADDHEVNRTILEQYLRGRDIDVILASSASEARARLAAAPLAALPDAALIDDAMPGENGTSLATSLRRDPKFRAMPLVLLTSATTAPETSSVFDAQLTKPVRLQALLGTLLDLLQGTASAIQLPAAQPPAVDLDPRARSVRLLLAEDHEVNRMLAVEILQTAGYHVDVVVNGADAVEARFAREYHLILMDCQMPVMDGFEATTAIRRREMTRARPVPIVAITANAIEGDREACLAAGMDDYISKPFTRAGLLSTVQRWTAGAAVSRRTTSPEVAAPSADTAPIDLACLSDLIGEAPEKLSRYLDMFVRSAETSIVRLRAAVAAGDPNLARQLAHKVKGSCGMVGANAMAAIAAEIEGEAAQGRLAGAPGLVDRLDASFTEARAFVAGCAGATP